MMQNLPKQTPRFIALIITVIGFGLRLYALSSESLWYDELLQANLSQMNIPDMVARLTTHSAVPLDYILLHHWISLGRSDVWVRLPAVMFGTLTLPVAYQLGRRLLGVYPGLLFMALLTYAPFHVRFSQEARPYALGLLGATLFVYFIWRLRNTGRWHYLMPILLSALIFGLAHYFASTIFGPVLAFLGLDFIFSRQRSRSFKALTAAVLAALLVVLMIVLLGRGVNLARVSSNFGRALAEPDRFNAPAAEKPDSGSGPIITQEFVEKRVIAPLGAGFNDSLWWYPGVAGLGLLNLLVQRRFKLALFLGLWVIAPVVGILTFLIHRGTFYAPRYIIFTVPGYYLLLTLGIMALPLLAQKLRFHRGTVVLFLLIGGALLVRMSVALDRLYHTKDKEDWHLAARFITDNIHPDDAVIAVRAEPTMSWYYPPAAVPGNYYDELTTIQETVTQARRSWIILSIFSSGIDATIKAWLSDGEQGAIRFVIDPVITVYYLGHNVDKGQLLAEIRQFVLPVDHAIYASLGRENRRNPEVARRYFELAIEHAPNPERRQEYQQALEAIQ